MDLRRILNHPAPAVVTVSLPQLANATYGFGKTTSDTASDCGDSSHTSEHSLQSSQPFNAVVKLLKDVRNPSPTQIQQPLPMLQNDIVVAKGLTSNTLLQGKNQEENLFTGFMGEKAYTCNMCGKGFARQYDLTRHSEQLCQIVLGLN